MTRLPRLLVIMGSGETSPTMVKAHRAVFERLGPPPVPAVLLDTPVGFQANAADIAARAVEYFRQSVGVDIEVASLRSTEGIDTLTLETALAQLRHARWVFSGPGSPTYALRHWRGTRVPAVLAEKLEVGGCITFASAAALTLGAATVPVYEIYKAGEDPRWLPGLDLLGAAGLRAAVIPHYDNAEGGTHDTRFCYLGERRLAAMEGDLPERAFVLGVDEHTGLILDLGAGTAEVLGLGGVTVRGDGGSTVIPSGTTISIDDLRRMGEGAGLPATAPPAPAAGDTGAEPPAGGHGGDDDRPAASLLDEVARTTARFDAAVTGGDVDGAVAAVLDLDDAMVGWSRDTLQSDEMDRARAALRSMVVRLGELAREGVRDPREAVAPLVDALLEQRDRARVGGDFATADRLRDRLAAAGLVVRDTPAGPEWDLAG